MQQEQVIYPKALIFTEGGTFIVKPVHTEKCLNGTRFSGTWQGCPGCRYEYLAKELIGLEAGCVEPTRRGGCEQHGT